MQRKLSTTDFEHDGNLYAPYIIYVLYYFYCCCYVFMHDIE